MYLEALNKVQLHALVRILAENRPLKDNDLDIVKCLPEAESLKLVFKIANFDLARFAHSKLKYTNEIVVFSK